MPSTIGSGLLFELCPEQLPPGFVMSHGSSAHDHHNHTASDVPTSADSADQCQIGHLLFTAMAIDAPAVDAMDTTAAPDFIPATGRAVSGTTASAYRSRAPPA